MSNTPEDAFKLTRTLAHHDLLPRKGVYPYEYIDSFARFDETQLPPKSAFESSLTEEGISAADYAHAQNVWQVSSSKGGSSSRMHIRTRAALDHNVCLARAQHAATAR